TGDTGLVVRIGLGAPLLLLAPVFQQSGVALYYRADGDFATPAALARAKVGRMPPTDMLAIELATAFQADGIDAAKLKSVPLEPGQTVAALAERSVDVAPGSLWEVPWQAREKGLALRSVNPAEHRIEYYGDTLFTSLRFATAEPLAVQRF